MQNSFSFHPNLVIRTPHFPLTMEVREDQLDELLSHPLFMEALYLASPVLYEECLKMSRGEISSPRELRKIRHSLVKYYTRMFSRCTPFGLFSGCSIARWDRNSRLVIDSSEFERHTRLDMHYLCALAQFLAGSQGVMEHLMFTRNSTLYQIGNEIRYIEYFYKEGKRTHKISAIVRTEYVDRIVDMAKGFHSMHAYAESLVDEDISLEDAMEFVRGLIDAQVLVSELEPAITGPEFAQQIISSLEKRVQDAGDTIPVILKFLRGVQKGLKSLDDHKVNDPQQYGTIKEMLQALRVPYDESKLFQCDLNTRMLKSAVSERYQSQLLKALEVLHRLSPGPEQRMDAFIQKFQQRYEDREMPLLEVLDAETGLVYKDNTGVELSPLLNEMVFPKPPVPTSYQWGKLEEFWKKKLAQAEKENAAAIQITDEDLKEFESDPRNFPPSLSLMFRVLDQEKELLYLESAGGSSAANLLGRFAHGNADIHALVNQITEAEQAREKEVILAEIVHLPESRMGNIMLHPAFRKYEIPYLAKSSLAEEFQIPVTDLMVSVQQGRVVLRSKRLNKEIVPRLSSAHNYTIQPLPVYHFLCDLQMQGLAGGFQFSWGDLAWQYQYLPRVQYGQTILHAATWQLRSSDWKMLTDAGTEELPLALKSFQQQWKMPDRIVIADGDNELLIDLSNPLLVNLFLEQLKSRQGVQLKEYLFTGDTGVHDSSGQPYANQLVAILEKKDASYTSVLSPVESVPVRESFEIGSEWIYFKIYCGSQSAEKILVHAIDPLVRELRAEGQIRKWFFIRYPDPEFHLRLRLELTETGFFGTVLKRVTEVLQPFQQDGFIWNTQLDTYRRETRRYGSRSIEAVEEIFCYSSEATLAWLCRNTGDDRESERWLWGLQSIDYLLNGFGYTLEQKLHLLDELKTSFGKEFHTGKLLKEQLDSRYREHRKRIELSLESEWPDAELIKGMNEKLAAVRELADNSLLEPSADSLLASLIHMQLNRLFTSKSRQHEMICYDFLYRYYHAKKMRIEYANKGKIKR